MQINASETPKKFHRKQISENKIKKAHTRDGLYYEFVGEFVHTHMYVYIYIHYIMHKFVAERTTEPYKCKIRCQSVSQTFHFDFFFEAESSNEKKRIIIYGTHLFC